MEEIVNYIQDELHNLAVVGSDKDFGELNSDLHKIQRAVQTLARAHREAGDLRDNVVNAMIYSAELSFESIVDKGLKKRAEYIVVSRNAESWDEALQNLQFAVSARQLAVVNRRNGNIQGALAGERDAATYIAHARRHC